jgi:hypothetical protein
MVAVPKRCDFGTRNVNMFRDWKLMTYQRCELRVFGTLPNRVLPSESTLKFPIQYAKKRLSCTIVKANQRREEEMELTERAGLLWVLVWTLFLSPVRWAQQPQQVEQKLGWIDAWREAAVAIGRVAKADVTNANGVTTKRDIFVPVGTGVIAALPNDASRTPCLITAKHVFYDPLRTGIQKVFKCASHGLTAGPLMNIWE